MQHQTTEKARAHAVGRLLSSLGREVKTRERNKVTWHLLRSIPLNGVADPRTCASCSQNWLKTHTGIGIGIGSDIDIRYRHPTLAVSGCRYRMSILTSSNRYRHLDVGIGYRLGPERYPIPLPQQIPVFDTGI